jgi:hypothetical protein
MILFGYLENKMGHLQMGQNPLFIEVYSINMYKPGYNSWQVELFWPLPFTERRRWDLK